MSSEFGVPKFQSSRVPEFEVVLSSEFGSSEFILFTGDESTFAGFNLANPRAEPLLTHSRTEAEIRT